MDLPESVIDLLTGLRDYLQDKCEPPVYVSDRRFMKAINLLQVASFADGREEVSLSCRIMGRKIARLFSQICCMQKMRRILVIADYFRCQTNILVHILNLTLTWAFKMVAIVHT